METFCWHLPSYKWWNIVALRSFGISWRKKNFFLYKNDLYILLVLRYISVCFVWFWLQLIVFHFVFKWLGESLNWIWFKWNMNVYTILQFILDHTELGISTNHTVNRMHKYDHNVLFDLQPSWILFGFKSIGKS